MKVGKSQYLLYIKSVGGEKERETLFQSKAAQPPHSGTDLSQIRELSESRRSLNEQIVWKRLHDHTGFYCPELASRGQHERAQHKAGMRKKNFSVMKLKLVEVPAQSAFSMQRV